MRNRQYDMLMRLVDNNEYLETQDEREIAFSAMYIALNWANRIDREERNMRKKYSNISTLTRLNHMRYDD